MHLDIRGFAAREAPICAERLQEDKDAEGRTFWFAVCTKLGRTGLLKRVCLFCSCPDEDENHVKRIVGLEGDIVK